MKKRNIKKIAVLGSGVMGSRIALHFAGMGVEALLLDIVPKDSSLPRNQIVNDALAAALKSKPSPAYHDGVARLVQTGNFDDDMPRIKDCDWIIEVVVEKLDIKHSVYEQVEKYRRPGTLITTNTSGIPIGWLAKGRSEDFRRHFCGTHFFNPPRYLRLLEIIPGPDTDPEIIRFLMDYGDRILGKDSVLCKDTPAFIANRIGVYAIMSALHTIEQMGLSVSEVDKLTGPAIGRPKSATFRTTDVVGLDTMVNVSNNLYAALTHDESREQFRLPRVVQAAYDNRWWGDKTGQGFYKMERQPSGEKQLYELNLKTLEYEPEKKAKFEILDKAKELDSLPERLRLLLSDKSKAGDFYRRSFYDTFRYCSNRIPEIADEVYRIDQAVCAGFGWEMGPFETWDALGVRQTVAAMEAAGMRPADWVYAMLHAGIESFYNAHSGQKLYFDIAAHTYKTIPGTESVILLDTLRKTHKLWGNAGSSIFEIGDGVLCLEFHSKMNSIGPEVIEGIHTAITMAEREFVGLVIGNEAEQFSAGANLSVLFMYACEQEYDEINLMIAQFQQTMIRARFSSVPVVAATAGLALGGGCELSLHCDAIQAHAETYIGLVEVGAGVIPAGGGTKEFALRASDAYREGDVELNTLQKYFMQIATAKVATSAHEARGMDILRPSDGITANRRHLIADAKAKVIELSKHYTQPVPRRDIKVQGKAGMALFEAGITGMLYGNYISEHDAKIARKLSYAINGGDLSQPTLVSEQYLLDLEREAFLSLTGEKKTLERIQSILFKGKPLRN